MHQWLGTVPQTHAPITHDHSPLETSWIHPHTSVNTHRDTHKASSRAVGIGPVCPAMAGPLCNPTIIVLFEFVISIILMHFDKYGS